MSASHAEQHYSSVFRKLKHFCAMSKCAQVWFQGTLGCLFGCKIIKFLRQVFHSLSVNIINFHHVRNLQMDNASGGLIAERWTTDSYKNFFGQIIVSDVGAFQKSLKRQIFDLCTSPNVSLFNGRIPWICDPLSTHMITTVSQSKKAKSSVDSWLLYTTPKYC